jgi:hypothetical protein
VPPSPPAVVLFLFTSISFMLARWFMLFPLTVIFTYRADTSWKEYFSNSAVVPLLLPEYTLAKAVPSEETEITKLFVLVSPLYHAISTLQIPFCCPKSAPIHEPIQLLDHLVLRLLSMVFSGTLPSSALAVTPFIVRLLHAALAASACPL